MATFKAIVLPLAVLCAVLAILLPPMPANRAWVARVLAGLGLVFAVIALFISADAAP